MSSKVVVKSLAELGALLDMESKPTTRDAEKKVGTPKGQVAEENTGHVQQG